MDFVQDISEWDKDEIYGYFVGQDYICRECVENNYSDDMEPFFADDPIPVTLGELLEEGYSCNFCEYQ